MRASGSRVGLPVGDRRATRDGSGGEQVPRKRAFARVRVPVTAVLVFGFAGATMVAVGLSLYLGFSGAIDSTRSLLYLRAEQTVEGLIREIEQELDPIDRQIAWFVRRVASGDVDPRDFDQWKRVVSSLPAGNAQVTAVAFFSPDLKGRLYVVDDDAIEARDFSTFPEAQSMLERAGDRAVWLPPLWSPRLGRMILAAYAPVFQAGDLLGVHVVIVALTDFSRRFARSVRQTGIVPFVVYDNDQLLIHPGIADWRPGPRGPSIRDDIVDSGQAKLLPGLESLEGGKMALLWKAQRVALQRPGSPGRTHVARIDSGGETEVFIYRQIDRFGPRPWLVGAHFNVDVVGYEIDRLKYYGVLGIAVLLVAVLGAVIVGRLTEGPVLRMAEAARSVHRGELESVRKLPSSPIREFDDAAVSFNEMVDGLRERARLRDLFGRYLPEGIAARLFGESGDLQPQTSVATVLFADIEKFTDLSEQLEPREIVDVLNAYFSAVVEIIEQYKGVVTQFQGDAVLAIFNVPLADSDHATNAVRTAVSMYRTVRERQFAGHSLSFRIGINTGNVVAGNVGARDRLTYTVHGDAVNVAARLEALNKVYGTRILLTAETAERITGIPLRWIDNVAIRGKSELVSVYTVRLEDDGANGASVNAGPERS